MARSQEAEAEEEGVEQSFHDIENETEELRIASTGSGYVILDIDKASPKLLNLYIEEKTQQYDEIPEAGKDI
jgi:hypothetical protein